MSLSIFRSVLVFTQNCFSTTAGLFTVVFLLAIASRSEAQVNERSSNWIRGVAHVSLDRSGKSQITFNPRRCKELGPDLCEFFRTHEYGHVNLRHLERGVPARQAEAEADVWAAKNASPSAVQAAKNFFLSGQGGSRVHGTPQERARRMNARTATTTTVKTVQRRPKSVAPKRYSATPNRVVRYVAKPVIPSGTSLKVNSSKKSPRSTSRKTPQTIRYVVRSTSQSTQTGRRTSTGYLPRGDFLNPR